MTSKFKPITIDLNIDGGLTSISCGHIIVELVKFLTYQRLQIPYTYQWLKQIVNKRKLCEDELKPLSFQAESHYHTVSTSLNNLDFILKSILQEINGCCMPQEICIALGGTPVAFKEVYRLLLPACHKVQCHSVEIASDQKIQRNVFRTLVTSEKLSELFTSPLPPTNMYVLVKKRQNNVSDLSCSDNFVYTNGYWIPRTSKVVVINFNCCQEDYFDCCSEFQVFGDIGNDLEKLKIEDNGKNEEQVFEIESTDNEKWYQSTYVMKGFKDCFINGSSVMNSWTD